MSDNTKAKQAWEKWFNQLPSHDPKIDEALKSAFLAGWRQRQQSGVEQLMNEAIAFNPAAEERLILTPPKQTQKRKTTMNEPMTEEPPASPQGEAVESNDLLYAVLIEGVLTIHLPDVSGNYHTLCGLDGDDEFAEQESTDVPIGAKVNCEHCKRIHALCSKFAHDIFV